MHKLSYRRRSTIWFAGLDQFDDLKGDSIKFPLTKFLNRIFTDSHLLIYLSRFFNWEKRIHRVISNCKKLWSIQEYLIMLDPSVLGSFHFKEKNSVFPIPELIYFHSLVLYKNVCTQFPQNPWSLDDGTHCLLLTLINAVVKPVEVWLELEFLELEYFLLAKCYWTLKECCWTHKLSVYVLLTKW